MKTALVFGATGFIGSHLLRDLLDSPDYSGLSRWPASRCP
ncbi:NAD-dependent epimerase/dehydratase family protein [Bradyrhizobium sp. USDA 223]